MEFYIEILDNTMIFQLLYCGMTLGALRTLFQMQNCRIITFHPASWLTVVNNDSGTPSPTSGIALFNSK
jgi:hypothetical protein